MGSPVGKVGAISSKKHRLGTRHARLLPPQGNQYCQPPRNAHELREAPVYYSEELFTSVPASLTRLTPSASYLLQDKAVPRQPGCGDPGIAVLSPRSVSLLLSLNVPVTRSTHVSPVLYPDLRPRILQGTSTMHEPSGPRSAFQKRPRPRDALSIGRDATVLFLCLLTV